MTKIEDAGFSDRVCGALLTGGYRTLEQLAGETERRILATKRIGRTALVEIEGVLGAHGLSVVYTGYLDRKPQPKMTREERERKHRDKRLAFLRARRERLLAEVATTEAEIRTLEERVNK